MTKIQLEQQNLQDARMQQQTETFSFQSKCQIQEEEIQDLKDQISKMDQL
jgi:hypothetical protein